MNNSRYLFQHFIGRRRNCYSITIRNVHRALAYATEGRKLKKDDMADLWKTRIMAGCEQHGVNFHTFRDGLYESNIQLNRKMLADLAIWEPRTFEALARISRTAAIEGDMNGVEGQLPDEPKKRST